MSEATVKSLPPRDTVTETDTWDLSSLYESTEAWESDYSLAEETLEKYAAFQGRLGENVETLAELLSFDSEMEQLLERLGYYAFLRLTEDQANSDSQALEARMQNLGARAAQAASWIRPELLAIDADTMDSFQQAECLQHYQLQLERVLRYRPHTLGEKEEQLLAMQAEMAQASSKTFRQLHDADLKFGEVENEKGELVELGNATFSQFLISPSREVRKTAFHQYYDQFQAHENTLAATLGGSIQKDVYYARARGYDSALTGALFPDNVPQSVYDSLIASVRNNFESLYKYYELRRRLMEIDEIHHYDTYVPIISDLQVTRTWDQATDLVMESLQPLGSEYCETLEAGLRGRWCDRYPNAGKQSGAFSAGSYIGDPYILMNYKPEVLNDVFTLTHEAGHSMHSFYSSKTQSFEYYNYTIFVAEVASTFNEQLLSHYMMNHAQDDRERAYLINRDIDAIRGTIIRQTMFAEFEKITHEMAENGQPLTVQSFREVYGQLLKDYFGPDFAVDDCLSLECFRIPHFYRAFYVYKYATGLSAAIALSKRVLNGGPQELEDYLHFLQGGCSKDPLDLLRDAGVDMEQPEPVDTALQQFASLVDQLESLLG
jgi:oligoendopeptidase F|tara:strand:- start:13758 stop:15569 length:1812 start_codon:yes stop_codon:yes gene_type:complete